MSIQAQQTLSSLCGIQLTAGSRPQRKLCGFDGKDDPCGHGMTPMILVANSWPGRVSAKLQRCVARRTYVTLYRYFRRLDLPSHGRHEER